LAVRKANAHHTIIDSLTLSALKCSHAVVTKTSCCCCCCCRYSSFFRSPSNVFPAPHTRLRSVPSCFG